MFKFLILLVVLVEIEAQYGSINSRARACVYPRFDHGRVRIRQKSKLIKFICFPGYELVGNKYATCRDEEWDVPLPVCVKPGCPPIQIPNGVSMGSRGGAWLVFFCLPGHQLVGSSALFCNGRKWNGTAPTCVDTTTPSKLSCDFEDANLCGWTQDELHDFDWKRLNKKTPSSFLFTGPSFDHTHGEDGQVPGYYMYIESTSRLENDTARLLSPIYDTGLTKNGCFQFYYHMFGKTTGGLRVFQKPDSLPLQTLLHMTADEREQYTLFEKWGNHGDIWYNSVTKLKDFSDSFQIVIEGIRGKSFTSDIAVDDVAILQGDECVAAAVNNIETTTPAIFTMPDSCANRCDMVSRSVKDGLICGCSVNCIIEGNCCPDFFDLCIFDSTQPDDNSPAELPQTQKLVASTIQLPASTIQLPASTTTTLKTTTLAISTTKPTLPTLPTLPSIAKPTTAKVANLTTIPAPVKTTEAPKTTKLVPSTTTKIPKLVFKTTTPVYNGTGHIHKDVTNKPVVVKPTIAATTKSSTMVVKTTPVPFKTTKMADHIDKSKEKPVEAKKFTADEVKSTTTSSSSGVKTALLTIFGLLTCIGLIWLVGWSQGARGREALARLRGRTRQDPEVRYLSADVDE